MKLKLFFLILAVLPLQAAFELAGSNAFSNAAGRSGVANPHQFGAFLMNPALTAWAKATRLGIGYAKPFGIPELNLANLLTNATLGKFGVGGAVHSFGNQQYREMMVSANLSRTFLQNKISLGVNFHWYRITIAHYGSPAQAFGLDLGAFIHLSQSVSTGFSLLNVNQPRLNGREEELPVVTTWGLAIRPADLVAVYLTLEKDRWYPVNLSLGVEASVTRFLVLQTGYQTNPTLPSLGLQFRHRWFAFYYALQYHFQLGATHSWGLVVSRNK